MRVAFVVKGYPRLSEAFIAQEIAALERRGLELLIVSLRRPTDERVHPVHREIKAQVEYLPEYLYRQPLRVWRAWLAVREQARARAGTAFNLKAFHGRALNLGPMGLAQLGRELGSEGRSV